MKDGVLITGAANRIGKEIAFYFASKGYDVAIHYNHSAEESLTTKKEIETKHGVQCRVFKADFEDRTQTVQLMKEVHSQLKIKHLINNASLFYENSFSKNSISDFDVFMKINFIAPYLLTQQFSEIVEDTGSIINILDTHISQNQTKHFDYLLSKKFLEIFTKQVAIELAPKIRVNGIAPGIILPPKDKNQEYIDGLAQKIPMKKTGNPHHITHAIDFLIHNPFVTGQIVFIDGGENL